MQILRPNEARIYSSRTSAWPQRYESIFSLRGSEPPLPDPNPILDEGAPISLSGIYAATHLCNLLGIPFNTSPCIRTYEHSWGPHPSCTHPVLGTWSFTLHDIQGLPTNFHFDLIDSSAPIVIGLDTRKFSDSFNLTSKPFVVISRPCDSRPRKFFTYIDSDLDGNERLRIELVPHKRSSVDSIISTHNMLNNVSPLSIAKRIHRYSHARYEDMKRLLETAGKLTPDIDQCLKSVARACEICSGHGRPSITRKISISRIDSHFNNEIQLDFVWLNVRDTRHVCLHIIDTFSSYSEVTIAPNRSQEFISNTLENVWIYRYGAPLKLSGDQEFDRSGVHTICNRHNISYCPRPTRRHNKTGIIERKNGVIKTILEKISSERCSFKNESIIARACFISNLFSGSKLLSSFQLARGYSPSILGVPSSIVPTVLLEAHKAQTATRALHKLLHSRSPNTVPANLLPRDRLIWVFHKSSRQNDPIRWEKAKVISTHPHYVLAKGLSAIRGPPMKVAYEDIRLVPQGKLTEELDTYTLEHETRQPDADTNETA